MKNKIKKYKNINKILIFFLKTKIKIIIGILFLLILTTLLSLASPIIVKYLIDDVLINKEIDNLIIIVILFLGIFIFSHIFQFFTGYLGFKLENYLTFILKYNCFISFFVDSICKKSKMSNGDYYVRINQDTSNFASIVINSITEIIQMIFLFITSIFLIYRFNALLSSTILIIIPFIIFTIVKFGPRLEEVNKAVLKEHSKLSGYIIDIIEKKKMIIQNSAISYIRKKLVGHERAYIYIKFKRFFNSTIYSSILSVMFFLPNLFVYGIGGYLVIQNKLSVGELVAFINYLGYVFAPFQSLTGLNLQFRSMIALFDRLEEILSYEKNKNNYIVSNNNEIEIKFNRVTYSYSENELPIIDNFSFSAEKGDFIKIEGPNGSGKTTIVNLINGYLYNRNINIKYSKNEIYKNRVGVITNEAQLIEGTLRENILLGLNISDDKIIKLINDLSFDDMLIKYNLDYIINFGTNIFSEGEKKKISIIRVLIRNPQILISDEGEDSLDSNSAKNYFSFLYKQRFNRITFIISHKLNNKLLSFDDIIIVNNNSI